MYWTILQDCKDTQKILWENVDGGHQPIREFLGGMPYVYRIEDPEPDRYAPLFGYNDPLQLICGEIRYVGVSEAKDGCRLFRKRRSQPFLMNWFTHLQKLGYGVEGNPIRVHIRTCCSIEEALELERMLTSHYGLGKTGGRLLNQVEGGGQTYQLHHTSEAKAKMAAAKCGKKLPFSQIEKMSKSGRIRADRERKLGMNKIRGKKISQGRLGKPHPHNITPEMREMYSRLGKSMKGIPKSLSHRLKLSEGKRKLSDAQCSEIIERSKSGEKRRALAVGFDVSRATIDNVINGKYAPFSQVATA